MPERLPVTATIVTQHRHTAVILAAGDIVTLRGLAPGKTPKLMFIPQNGFNAGMIEEIDPTHRSAERFTKKYINSDERFIVVKADDTGPLPKGCYRITSEIRPLILMPFSAGKIDVDGPFVVAHQYGTSWGNKTEVGKAWTHERTRENTQEIQVTGSNPDLLEQLRGRPGNNSSLHKDPAAKFLEKIETTALAARGRNTQRLENDIQIRTANTHHDIEALANQYGFTDLSGNDAEFHIREIEKHTRKLELAYQNWFEALERNTDVLARSRRVRGVKLALD